MFIRLVYALTSMDIESKLQQFLQGTDASGDPATVSASQLNQLNNLLRKIVKEEEWLIGKLPSLQEEVAILSYHYSQSICLLTCSLEQNSVFIRRDLREKKVRSVKFELLKFKNV